MVTENQRPWPVSQAPLICTIRPHPLPLWCFEDHICEPSFLQPVQMLKDSITPRGRGLKQVDLWRFSGWSSHLLYVLRAPTSPCPKSTAAWDIVSYYFILCDSIGSQALPFSLGYTLWRQEVCSSAIRNTFSVIVPVWPRTLTQLSNRAWRIKRSLAECVARLCVCIQCISSALEQSMMNEQSGAWRLCLV